MVSPWAYVYIAAAVLVLCAVFWAYNDALGHSDEGCTSPGCFWILMFIFFPPSILFYIVMRLLLNRRAPRSAAQEYERERMEGSATRFPSDIDKLRLLKYADQEHGTMFDPDASASQIPEGFPHFTDSRVEAFLEQFRHAEALDYLLDVYGVALDDHDARACDTYRHYLSRIPGGLAALREWKMSRDGDDGEVSPPAGRSGDVPF